MRPISLLLVLATFAVLAGAALAEEVRLRDGRMLQGEVLRDSSDDQVLALRLFATGGVVRIQWKDVAQADRKRLRAELGFERVELEEVDGHRVTFLSGKTVVGLAENPDEKGSPLVVKTAEGRQSYRRADVAGIESVKVLDTTVYTPDEIVETWLADQGHPKTPTAHAAFADRCFSVGAYQAAKEHYEMALAGRVDPGVTKNIRRCELFLDAENARAGLKRVRTLSYRRRFDEALARIAEMRKEYADRTEILEELDRWEARLRKERRSHLFLEVQRRFGRVLEDLTRRKVRENPSFADAVKWCLAKDGLPGELFEKLAKDIDIEAKEARELWAARGKGKLRRFRYGPGAFLHPEEVARAKKEGRETRSGEDWWASARLSDRALFLRAWLAEFSGLLEVMRVEVKPGPVRDRVLVCR